MFRWLMELPLEVGCLPHFPTMRVGTSWSSNATCTKYPSILTIEMHTIFKQVWLFIKCPVYIKKIKSFVVGHGHQPHVAEGVQDLVVVLLPHILISGPEAYNHVTIGHSSGCLAELFHVIYQFLTSCSLKIIKIVPTWDIIKTFFTHI